MDRLAISFSGGRSSAVMLDLCLDAYSELDISITFANTGCEHEETLRFVDAIDRNLCRPRGREVVWIEAEVTQELGVGPAPRIVDYATASRDGKPFRETVRKYGVFNRTRPQCTTKLKEDPMRNYRRRVLGWEKGSYSVAVGIRADEVDRVSARAAELRLIYPLVDARYTRRDVNEHAARWPWDLRLPSDAHGNCVWCWKKSLRKLYTVAAQTPEAFDFPAEMERLYGEGHRTNLPGQVRTFFRENRSAEQIVAEARAGGFRPYTDEVYHQIEMFDHTLDLADGGCSESCEPFEHSRAAG